MEEVRDNQGDILYVEGEIAVYEWCPLPEGLGGAGLPPTLYEVTPTTNGGKPRETIKTIAFYPSLDKERKEKI